jgi:hypothetical protein
MEKIMKKVLIGISIIAILATSVYAFGTLTGSQTSGLNKICFYSDGTAVNVKSYEICPVSN